MSSINPTSTAAQPSEQQQQQAAPPSVVAMGTNVPSAPIETAEAQQASTMPGDGGVVEAPISATTGEPERIPFKEQVNGYAKKFAGTVFGNKDEKAFGEKKLEGEL